jgi:hypothetical protein
MTATTTRSSIKEKAPVGTAKCHTDSFVFARRSNANIGFVESDIGEDGKR